MNSEEMQAARLELIELLKKVEHKLDEVAADVVRMKRKFDEISNNEDKGNECNGEMEESTGLGIAKKYFKLGKDSKARFEDIVMPEVEHGLIAEWFFRFSKFQWPGQEVFYWCCRNGNLDIAQWWHGENEHLINVSEGGDRALKLACQFGHLPVAKWLTTLDQFTRLRLEEVYSDVVEYKHDDVIEWIKEMITLAN